MAITRVQNWTAAGKSDGTGSVVTNTLGAVPTTGNLLVAFLANGDGGASDISGLVVADTIGDGVSWTAMTVNPVDLGASGNNRHRGFYKVVGTPSGGGTNVTATISGTQALILFVAEYGVDTGSPTWSVDGSQISDHQSTSGPADAGDIVVTGTNTVLVGFSASNGSIFDAGTGYTRQVSDGGTWAAYAVEDQIISASGTYPVDWTGGSGISEWAAIGIAFTATTGGPTTSFLPLKSSGMAFAPFLSF